MDTWHAMAIDAIDERALCERWIECYGNPVYKFCRSMTPSKETAEDLFQETFAKVYAQMRRHAAHDNPLGLILSVAVSLWKSERRKYARRARIAPMGPLHDEIDEIPGARDVGDEYLAREQRRAVRDAVNALPDKLRITVILHYVAEAPVAEIAAALHIPSGTVKSRLYRARELVKQGLEAAHDDA